MINLGSNHRNKECKSFKYLGLIIDNLLKFDLHVDYIKKKIQKRIGAMYRGGSLLPVKYRKMFANALILPHFDYLDTIYKTISLNQIIISKYRIFFVVEKNRRSELNSLFDNFNQIINI